MEERLHVLVIDDEDRFRNNMVKLLGLHGFDVVSAKDGEEGLALLTDHTFDVILLDLKMPGLSGGDVLPFIKKNSPDSEVIILTGHASIDSAAELLEKGATDYLLKPCSTEELVTTIRMHFDRKTTVRPG